MISCTPLLKSRESYTPASTAAIELSATNTSSPEVTATQHTASTATIGQSATYTTLPEMIATQYPTSAATIEPSITLTTLPEMTATQPVFSIIQREYNPSDWKVLYDKGSVWQIDLGSKEQMWIYSGKIVGYFDGNNWVLFSEKDYGFPTNAFDMAIAPDGTVWLAGRQAISHYKDGFWYIYSIQDAPGWSNPRLAIDSSNLVWLALWGCHCRNNIKTFDGINWIEQSLWSTGLQVEVYQLLFTPDGTLWVSFYNAIGPYNGKIRNFYSGTELWPKGNNWGIQIASDNQGNIFGIDYGQEWIVKINRDGSISKVLFDFVNYEFIPELMRLFIDKQGRIWTNACFKENVHNCLAYYQDNQWISFRNFPFGTMTDMKELADGTLLVATDQGLFQYKPEN